MATNTESLSGPVAAEVMEIRLTEVLDVTSFWAQIGTSKHLTAYDDQQREMSTWCEECSAGCHNSSASLKLEAIVAVRGKTKGTWVRSKVTKIISEKLVDLFYMDTGVTEYADVRSICVNTPPMLCAIPQQALQCSLGGVKMPKGVKEWSKAVESRFQELTWAHTKCMIHEILEGNCIVVSVFIPYKGVFMSVGEIMKLEGLVEYEPRSPLTLDIPVPQGLNAILLDEPETMPINCYITNTLQKQLQSTAATGYASEHEEEHKPSDICRAEGNVELGLSENDEELSCSNVDRCGVVAPRDSLNSAHPDGVSPSPSDTPKTPRTPSHEEFEDVENSAVISPPLLITETVGRSCGGLVDMVAKKRVALQSLADKAAMNKAPEAPPSPPKTKAESQGDLATSEKENSVVNLRLLSDSGSELSDNDWLDEDLLPRRSAGNSELSDVVVESPVKNAPPEVVSQGASTVAFETALAKKCTPQESFTRNHILEDSAAGNTPHPRREQVPLYTHPYTGRSLRGVFQSVSKDSWQPRECKGRGKGNRKVKGDGFARRNDAESKERQQSTIQLRGRGRGGRDKFSRKNSAPCQQAPPLRFPITEPTRDAVVNRPCHSFSEDQREHSNPGFSVRMPAAVATEHPSSDKLGFGVRRPTTEHSSSGNPGVRMPAAVTTERSSSGSPGVVMPAEHSPSDSPQKPASRTDYSSSPTYSQRVKVMSDHETDCEVRWHEWRIEDNAAKILRSLCYENVKDVGEKIEQLLCGPTAVKLRELPKYRNPLQIVLECMIEKGVAKTTEPSLFMLALEELIEGPSGAEVCKTWLNAIGKKASESVDEELSKDSHTFCCFVGSLFCLPLSNSLKEVMVETVSSCLVVWTKLVSMDSHQAMQRCELQVECFGALLDTIYSSPNATALEGVVNLLLNGLVTDCVLCDQYPRSIRQAWHNETVKVRKPPSTMQTGVVSETKVESGVVPGTELNQGVPGCPGTELNPGLEPVNQSVLEFSQSQQVQLQQMLMLEGMELTQVQQRDLLLQGMELTREPGVLAYPHSFSPQVPASPIDAYPGRPLMQEVSPQVHTHPPPPLLQEVSPQGILPYPQYQMSEGEVLPRTDSYTKVMMMLETLHLTELFPKFTAAMIKDPVLEFEDLSKVKDCLKDADIPSGPVLQILYYLECAQKVGSPSGEGVHQHHTRQLSNPATPLSLHPQNLATAATTSLPNNARYITGQQQMVPSPYQIPVSQTLDSPTGLVGGTPASPLTTYQMQPPPLGNKQLPQQSPLMRSAATQQQLQRTTTQQPTATLQQMQLTATQQLLQQIATQRQMQSTVTQHQMQPIVSQQHLQPTVTHQQMQQTATQQQMQQTTAQQHTNRQQMQQTSTSTPIANSLHRMQQPASLMHRSTMKQQVQQTGRGQQMQHATIQPAQPAVMHRQQFQSVRLQQSPQQASICKELSAGQAQNSASLQQTAYDMPPTTTDFDFPSLPTRKPKPSPAHHPKASFSSQTKPSLPSPSFQLPPSQPRKSGFGCINCVVCGGTDHVTSNCGERSKFFTHM